MDYLTVIGKSVALFYSLIFLYTFITYPFDRFLQNSLFLQVIIILAYIRIIRKIRYNYLKLVAALLMIISVIPSVYISLNYVDVAYRAGIPTTIEFLFGLITIVAILSLTSIYAGKALAITSAAFILYAYFGNLIPGMWGHGGYPLHMLIGYLYMTTEGLWSLPMSIAATYVVAFNILGSLLNKIKTAKFIMDGLTPLSKIKGGPGIIAVLSNMLLGMVSGSAPENAAITGTALRPLLISYGYSPERSAAIIASAAAGALIMPPVMGAAAFLMADLLGVTYRDIVIAAFIPGFLYFISLLIHVYLDSSALISKGLLSSLGRFDSTRGTDLIKNYGHTLIPLLVVTYFILVGYSPTRAAMYGIITSLIISVFRKITRIGFKDFVDAVYEALDRVVSLGIAISAACLIYSSIMLTGLGLKLSLVIESLSGGNILLILLLIAISCIILGMGLPATVAYLIVAITIASSVVKLGIPAIAAHMFIFYFSTFSTITPPVALALYTACAVFNSNIMKSGYHAIRLAIPAFTVPYVFVIRPSLLALGMMHDAVMSFIIALLGLTGISIAFSGYFLRRISLYERVIYAFAGILALIPETTYLTDIAGFMIFIIMTLINIMIAKGKLKTFYHSL